MGCSYFIMIGLFAMSGFSGMEAFAGDKPVVRGERPPIILDEVPEEAYEKGVIRIRFEETASKSVLEMELDRTKEGTVTLGFAGVDALNAQYGVSDARGTFDSPALKNRHTERHQKWGLHLWYDLYVDESTDIIAMIKDYMQLPEVSFAEPHYKKELIGNVPNDFEQDINFDIEGAGTRDGGQLFPDDPDFGDQWHYHNTGQTGGTAGADISLPEAWTIETGNNDIIIAVVDGGIAITHPDLEDNIWDGVGYNFVSNTTTIVPHNHGSHVGGTIGAVTNNNLGVSGIAGGWGTSLGVSLMSAQVFEPGWGQSGGFAQAPIYAADNDAAVSQNSWGYTSAGYYEQAVLDAIDYFNINGGGDVMDGGLTIFAAGNSSNSNANYPGYYSGAVAVAATNHKDELAWYSNFGSHIELSAPGGETNTNTIEGVLSTLNTGYDFYQGTSMACPHVSGVIALILSMAPGEFTNEEVLDFVKDTTDDIDASNPGYIGQLGTGRLNAMAALQEALFYMADPDAPAAPTNFTITADEDGELSATLSWTNPTESASGEPLADLDTIKIFHADELIHYILDPVIGEEESFTYTDIDEDGTYMYVIRGANFAGEGLAAAASAYIGHDVPAAPTDITLSAEGSNGAVIWTAPTVGLNDGFFDGSNLTYTVVRFPDETVVASETPDTTYFDNDIPEIGNYYYEVTAHNHVGEGGTDASNIATLGAAGLLIFEPFDIEVGELPTGWYVEGDNPGNWGTHNSATAGGEAPQMRLNWSPSFTGVSVLHTHVVDVADYSELRFAFRNYLRNYGSGGFDIFVEYTVDDGDTWVELMTFNDGSADYGPEHEEFFIDVPDDETIQFAFRWDGNSFNIWDWNIDDVILEALVDHYEVTFEVEDDFGNALEEAVVYLNGFAYNPGQYHFDEVETGTHTYKVEKEGYQTVEGEFEITEENVLIQVVMETQYILTFEVLDEEGNLLEDAVVTLDTLENEPGDFVFDELIAGSYPFTVEAEGFEVYEGEVEIVDEDVTQVVNMEELTYVVTFDPMDEDGEFVENAVVTLDGIENAPGDYVFDDIKAGTYNYVVEKEGYFPVEDTLEVIDEDVTEEVTLPTDDTGVDVLPAEQLTIFPNPARDRIYIESAETIKEIQLLDISGQMHRNLSVDALQAELDVNNLRAGIYFIRIRTEEQLITTRIQIMR